MNQKEIIGVIGSGTMGNGIAHTFAQKDFQDFGICGRFRKLGFSYKLTFGLYF